MSLGKMKTGRRRHRAFPSFVSIDTIAHNYLLIDAMIATSDATLLSREKWYYILYNAIIERETLCKDIFIA